MKYKKLISFDFDETLCHTPLPEEGKIIWKEKTGTDWPYIGWWGKSESIDLEVFDVRVNPWVYEKYLEAKSNPDAYVILATGRLAKAPKMRENVEKILNKHNLSFDEIHLNWGGDTYLFKKNLFEQTIEKVGSDEFIMYDDRTEHLEKFNEWASEQHVDVIVVDVVKKEENKYKNI